MQNKKEKIAYYLLGLGCGIVLSGMVMLGVSLKSIGRVEQVVAIQEEQQHYLQIKPSIAEIKPVITTTSDLVEPLEEEKWVEITIPAHAGSQDIVALLVENRVIEDAQAFSEYIKMHKKTKSLQHGTLLFPRKGQYSEVLDILLTIPQ